MATLVLGAIGTAVGGPLGGIAGSLLGAWVDNKIFNRNYVPRPNPWDLVVESAAFGQPLTKVYGRNLVAGNLIASTNLIPQKHTQKKAGGKGGPGGGGQSYYTYSAIFAVSICQTTNAAGVNTPISNVWRIYADSKLIWSMNPADFTINPDNQDVQLQGSFTPTSYGGVAQIYEFGQAKNADTQSVAGSARIYYGFENQIPDSDLQSLFGADVTPAFRGLAYAIFDMPLQYFGNRIPNIRFEVNGFPSSTNQQPNPSSTTYPPVPPSQITPQPATLFNGSALQENNLQSLIGAWSGDTIVMAAQQYITQIQASTAKAGLVVNLTTDPIVTATYASGVQYNVPGNGAQGPWCISGMDGTVWLSVQPIGGGAPALLNLSSQLNATGTSIGVKAVYALAGDSGTGLGAMSGAGLTAWCGSTNLLLVTDSTKKFQVYDMTLAATPTLVLYGDVGQGKIWEIQNGTATLVWNRAPSANAYLSPTCIAWSGSLNELVLLDGNNQVQFVLQGNGNTTDYTSLTSISGPVDLSAGLTGPAPYYAIYDATGLVWVYQGTQDIYTIADATVGTVSSHTTAATVSGVTGAAWAQGYGQTLLNQGLTISGQVAALVPSSSGNQVFLLATSSLSVKSSWSWLKAQDINYPLLYSPQFGGALNWPTYDSNGFAEFTPNVAASTSVAAIVGIILQECGLTPSQYDLSALIDNCWGYAIGSEVSGRTALEPLQQAFLFDLIESNNKLTARYIQQSTSSPQIFVDEQQIGARPPPPSAAPGGQAPPRFRETRKNDADLPQQIFFRYRTATGSRYVVDFSMEVGTQYAKRNHAVVGSLSRISLNSPLVLDDVLAAQVAEKVLFTRWSQRTMLEFSLPLSYLQADAGDVLNFTFHDTAGNTITYLAYVTDWKLGADDTIELQAVTVSPATLVSIAKGGSGPTGGGGPLGGQGLTFALMDIPPLQDADDSPGLYYAACGSGKSTTGFSYTVQRSIDEGQTYATIGTSATPAAIGFAVTALPAGASTTMWDLANTVKVNMIAGALASVTPKQVLAGQNVFLIGSELVGAAKITQNGDGTYTLATLLRGLQGTDVNWGTHAVSEQIVLLSPASLGDFTETLGDIQIDEIYAAIPGGFSISAATIRHDKLQGNRIKPEAAASAFITRDGSNNATISWTPRRRIGYQWNDGPEAPYTDEQGGESYSIDVYNGMTVVRTITTWTNVTGTVGPRSGYDLGIRQTSYTAAQQTADGLTPGNPIKVSIYELSTRTGWSGTRGFARTITQ